MNSNIYLGQNIHSDNPSEQIIMPFSFIDNVEFKGKALIGQYCSIGLPVMQPDIESGVLDEYGMGKFGVLIGKNFIMNCYSFIQSGLDRQTHIGDNVIIASHVGIGHDCIINNGCQIKADTALFGWSEIGENTIIEPRCTILRGVKIGRNCIIQAGSMISHDIKDNMIVETIFKHKKVYKNETLNRG